MTEPMSPSTLRAWRKRLGWSQRTAAAEIGISLRQMARYERGEADIPLTVALACAARALGIRAYPSVTAATAGR